MAEIASRRNPQIRLIRSLKRAKARRESGLFLVEGLRHIGELLASDFATEFILCAPEGLTGEYGQSLLETARQAGIPVYSAPVELLDGLSDKRSSAAMLAVARQTALIFDSQAPPVAGWSVALAAPRDPGNIGTILRTMDAFRAGNLYLLDGGADPWQPAAVRAAMGALFTHPVVEGSFAEFAAWAAAHDLPVYGTSAQAEADIRTLPAATNPAVLLFGSERAGLTPEQQAACRAVYRIPIHGRGTSLNLAVAAGIVLYNTTENRLC
ncbi:MAG TPA: RNA methyltransferase [Anaerolineales bacterium]|nr:RNA methyltransferase [Anaerolineales bacterium]